MSLKMSTHLIVWKSHFQTLLKPACCRPDPKASHGELIMNLLIRAPSWDRRIHRIFSLFISSCPDRGEVRAAQLRKCGELVGGGEGVICTHFYYARDTFAPMDGWEVRSWSHTLLYSGHTTLLDKHRHFSIPGQQ